MTQENKTSRLVIGGVALLAALAGSCDSPGAGGSQPDETSDSKSDSKGGNGKPAGPAALDDPGDSEDIAPAETVSPEPGENCGNGTVEDGEACDDGNGQNADGCNTNCTVSGELRWEMTVHAARWQAASHNERFRATDLGNAILPGPDGTAVVVGSVAAGQSQAAYQVSDAWVGRFSAGEGLQWSQTIAGPGGTFDNLVAVAAGREDSFFIAGTRSGEESAGTDGWLAEYDFAGTERQSLIVDGALSWELGPGSLSDMFIAGDGVFVVAGTCATDAVVCAIGADGSVVWQHSRATLFPDLTAEHLLGYDLSHGVVAESVAQMDNGDVMVAGRVRGTSRDYGSHRRSRDLAWHARLTASGELVWATLVPKPRWAELVADGAVSPRDVWSHGEQNVMKGAGGNFVICSEIVTLRFSRTARVEVFDESGASVWQDLYEGTSEDGAGCNGVALDSENNLVATGSETEGAYHRPFVRKYSESGNVLWTALGASGVDRADTTPIRSGGYGIAVGENDEIWVTGTLSQGGEEGLNLWVAAYAP